MFDPLAVLAGLPLSALGVMRKETRWQIASQKNRPSLVQAVLPWVPLVVFFGWLFSVLDLKPPREPWLSIARFVVCSPLAVVAVVQFGLGILFGFVLVRLWQFSGFRPAVPLSKSVLAAVVVGIVLFGVSFGGAMYSRRIFVAICA
jgi:hypothetical protein